MALTLQYDLDAVRRKSYGNRITGLKPEYYRMCWDSHTPTQDFLISPHSAVPDLFVAGGGSFHGFKFLPTIGDYIVHMINGTLESELAVAWAWDTDNAGKTASPEYAPTRDLQDIYHSDKMTLGNRDEGDY